MERDYAAQYTTLIRQVCRGAAIKAFLCGYNSKTLENYLEQKEQKLWEVREEAFKHGKEYRNPENEAYDLKLYQTRVRRLKEQFGIY